MNKKENSILIDVVQRLSRIEEKVSNIENHTKTMNKELGECKEEIKEIKNKFFVKLSWKQVTAIITGVSGLIGLLANIDKIIKFFMGV